MRRNMLFLTTAGLLLALAAGCTEENNLPPSNNTMKLVDNCTAVSGCCIQKTVIKSTGEAVVAVRGLASPVHYMKLDCEIKSACSSLVENTYDNNPTYWVKVGGYDAVRPLNSSKGIIDGNQFKNCTYKGDVEFRLAYRDAAGKPCVKGSSGCKEMGHDGYIYIKPTVDAGTSGDAVIADSATPDAGVTGDSATTSDSATTPDATLPDAPPTTGDTAIPTPDAASPTPDQAVTPPADTSVPDTAPPADQALPTSDTAVPTPDAASTDGSQPYVFPAVKSPLPLGFLTASERVFAMETGGKRYVYYCGSQYNDIKYWRYGHSVCHTGYTCPMVSTVATTLTLTINSVVTNCARAEVKHGNRAHPAKIANPSPIADWVPIYYAAGYKALPSSGTTLWVDTTRVITLPLP
ncbi:MAG: hypothetical protein HQ508_01015 [Candidatus Marinimicrobia bacterium]|nr:hypothetical protein [Candidatus Neomarinimicrobiota bacterium]